MELKRLSGEEDYKSQILLIVPYGIETLKFGKVRLSINNF